MLEESETKQNHKVRIDYFSSRVLSIGLPAIYASILSIFCLTYKVFPGPEFIVLLFFIYAAYNRRTHHFVKDWIPFVTLFVSFEAMYGLVGSVSGIVHIQEPIRIESELFGTIPTLLLQHLYRMPILDYLGALFYSLHFIAPTVFAFVLWKYHPKHYWKYSLAFAISTYSALITFLIYPVAPPWYGVNATRVLFQVDHDLGLPIYRSIFDFIQPNPFAAFPSLHATYPWLISLYALKIGKKKALAILVLPVFVWFSAIYLGEHYVVDILGGIAYATFAFLVVEKLVPRLLSVLSARKHSQEMTLEPS
jgi:membrane-associated phospholipid phosphatase